VPGVGLHRESGALHQHLEGRRDIPTAPGVEWYVLSSGTLTVGQCRLEVVEHYTVDLVGRLVRGHTLDDSILIYGQTEEVLRDVGYCGEELSKQLQVV
jgi:hypothetical protein